MKNLTPLVQSIALNTAVVLSTLHRALAVLDKIGPEIDEEYEKAKAYHEETMVIRRAKYDQKRADWADARVARDKASDELEAHDRMPWLYKVNNRAERGALVSKYLTANMDYQIIDNIDLSSDSWLLCDDFPGPIHLHYRKMLESTLKAINNSSWVTVTPEQTEFFEFLKPGVDNMEACMVRWAFDLMNCAVRNRNLDSWNETWPEFRAE